MRYLLPFLQAIILSSALKLTNRKRCHADIYDEFRWTAIYRMNFYREMLAQGMAPNKTDKLPGAQNMYKLWYDCALEDFAYNLTSACGDLEYPINSMFFASFNSTPMPDAAAPGILGSWITEHVAITQIFGIAADVRVTWSTRHWSLLATGRRTRVGCSYKMDCNASQSMGTSEPYFCHVVCIFDTYPADIGQSAYEVGPKCTRDSECTTYAGSTCDVGRGLCEFHGDSANVQCPAKVSNMIDPQRQLIAANHNYRRSTVARGYEQGDHGAELPPAKRMTKIVMHPDSSEFCFQKYSCEAEKSAQEWASQCIAAHSPNRNNTGENLYFFPDSQKASDIALLEATLQWWGEVERFAVGPDGNLTVPVWAQGLGNYTQMIWQETTEVGCAWAHCPDFTSVVCHYKPAGNQMYQLIYEPGPACQTDEDCGSGRTCIVSDEFRQTALYRFNFYREMLAYGIAPNQTGALPGAKNMYKLASFESAMYLDRKTLASAPDILTAMITGHIKEAQTYGVAAEAKVTINTINWGQYATGRRTRVGCSYRMKCRAKNPMRPFRYYMACVFDTSASSYGDPAYEAGSKCAQDSDCTTYPGSSCDAARGLCEYDGTVINPQCPKAAYSLTGTQRDLVVNTHNQLRSSLALGNEPDRAGFNAPPARRMTKMRYSCEAEKSVYKWTTPCPASDFLKRNNTGENTYYRAGYVEPVDALKEAIVLSSSMKLSDDKNCRPEVTEDFRTAAVERLNLYRQMLAQEMAPNKDGWLPGAKNMYKIWYDCSLEDIAYQFTSTCGKLAVTPPNTVWMSGYLALDDISRLPSILQSMMRYYIAEATTVGFAADWVNVSTETSSWAELATGRRTRIGCAYNLNCPALGYLMACVFDTRAADIGELAYQVGDGCATDSDCTTYPGSKCDAARSLCEYKYSDARVNSKCPGTTSMMTDAQRDLVLDWHNHLRSGLARGVADVAFGYAPTAKRMTKMTYSCGAEKTAYEVASRCYYSQSTNKGENVYINSFSYQDPADALNEAIQSWWKESSSVSSMSFPNLTDSTLISARHFSQMAWQETTEVGCAWAHCVSFTYVVCHYRPPGNELYRLVYEPGPPCKTDADCGSRRKCLVNEGLCQQCPGPKSKVTDAQRDLVLGWHNLFRSKLAKGNAPDKDGGNAPPARRMTKMKYSCGAEQSAQEWASECKFGSSPDRKDTGENVFSIDDNATDPERCQQCTAAMLTKDPASPPNVFAITSDEWDAGAQGTTQGAAGTSSVSDTLTCAGNGQQWLVTHQDGGQSGVSRVECSVEA
ncbi:unnamed protein product, partial [Mesorhabditis spiculigera]